MKRITWYDGRSSHADTWEDLEQLIRDSQWSKYPTLEAYREEMADRAMVWAGIEIDTDGTALDFFWELERAGFLTIDLEVASGCKAAVG